MSDALLCGHPGDSHDEVTDEDDVSSSCSESSSERTLHPEELDCEQEGVEIKRATLAKSTTQLNRDVAFVKKQAVRFFDMHRTFSQNLTLAVVVGFWVCLFSLPILSFHGRLFFFGESDEKLQEVVGDRSVHRWCNITFNSSTMNESLCQELDVSDPFEIGDNLPSREKRIPGKHCHSHPGVRFWGQIHEFWIGNDKNNYFPIVANTEPIMVWNGTKLHFEKQCRYMCETSERCARWTFWHENPGIGGRCYFFDADAPRIPTDWGWRGGSCVVVHAFLVECGPADLGRMRNVAPVDAKPELQKWDKETMSSWNGTRPGDIWCGMLPERYAEMWVNGAQMIIYTVFMNTGTTMRLAWQGVMGTICACLNLLVMKVIYPDGAAMRPCNEEEQREGKCVEDELVFKDSNYNSGWCLFDLLLVLALFLISGAEENTIKFGMSWHIYFMMTFMNPKIGAVNGFHVLSDTLTMQWDDTKCCALLMYFVGGLVAVLATLVPKPHPSCRAAFEGMKANANAINQVWCDSIEYFCAGERSVMRFKIQTKLDHFPNWMQTVDTNLGKSWWELAIGLINRKQRALYRDIHNSMAEMQELLYALRDCILCMDFSERHEHFSAVMREPMRQLHEVTSTLLLQCLLSPHHGVISKRDRKDLLDGVDRIRGLQRVLLKSYREAAPEITEGLADECVFAFALSASARKIADLAQRLATPSEGDQRGCFKRWAKAGCSCFTQIFHLTFKGLAATWAPSRICKASHLQFAGRNFLSISLCLVIGIYGHQLLPTYMNGYSATMANTLALLISHHKDSAWQKNTNRLLGVVFGKVGGFMGSLWLGMFACGSTKLFTANFVTVWAFVSLFCYMYYTDSHYRSLGCHIAAFGVVPLLDICRRDVSSTFASRYKEIGAITTALVVQFCVDMVFNRTKPGDLVVAELKSISESFLEAYRLYIHQEDMPALEQHVQVMRGHLQEAWRLLPECDPKLRCLPVLDTPFKFELCTVALENLQALLSDLKLLLVAVADKAPAEAEEDSEAQPAAEDGGSSPSMIRALTQPPEGDDSPADARVFSEPLRLLFQQPCLVRVRQAQEQLLEDILDLLPIILAHNKETPLEDSRFRVSLSRTGLVAEQYDERRTRPQLYKELEAARKRSEIFMGKPAELTDDTTARLAVAVRACRNVEFHLRVIHERCLKEDIY